MPVVIWKYILCYTFKFTGVLILWTSDDCPQGPWVNRKLPDKKTPSSEVEKSKDGRQPDPKDGQRNGIVNTAFDSGTHKYSSWHSLFAIPSHVFQWQRGVVRTPSLAPPPPSVFNTVNSVHFSNEF